MIEKFGDLFEKSFNEYRENFKNYLIIFIILSLIPALLTFYFGFHFTQYMNFLDKDASFETIKNHLLDYPYLTLFILSMIVSSLIGCFFMTTLLFKTMNIGSKKNPNVLESFSGGIKYFFKYLGLMLLFLLIIIILLIPISGLFILDQLANPLYLFIYFFILIIIYFLLLIPFVIFAIYWIFAPYILIGENKGVIESLKISKKLIENRWFETFGLVLLFTLVAIVISLPFSLLTYGAENLINSIVILGIVKLVVNFLNNLITMPLSLLFFKNVYIDIKKGQEKKTDVKKRKKKKKNA